MGERRGGVDSGSLLREERSRKDGVPEGCTREETDLSGRV